MRSIEISTEHYGTKLVYSSAKGRGSGAEFNGDLIAMFFEHDRKFWSIGEIVLCHSVDF